MILRVTTLLALLILTIEAKKFTEASEEQQQQWQEFEEFLQWKKMKEQREIKYEKQQEDGRDVSKIHQKQQQNPPPIDQAALMARYIVNQADWAPVATISTRKEIETFPVANVISFSDGPLGNGSGVPYMYLTPLDFTAQDLAKDHRATMLMTLAQGEYCRSKAWDPMDPRCARVMLSGKIKALRNDTYENDVAKKAVFERHPKLVHMPADHHFFFAKLKIVSIVMLDTFGGPKYINVKEYLNPNVNVTEEFLRQFPLKENPLGSNPQGNNLGSNLLYPMVRNV